MGTGQVVVQLKQVAHNARAQTPMTGASVGDWKMEPPDLQPSGLQ